MSIYYSSIIRFLGDSIPKNQPSNDLTMAGFELAVVVDDRAKPCPGGRDREGSV